MLYAPIFNDCLTGDQDAADDYCCVFRLLGSKAGCERHEEIRTVAVAY